MSDEMAEIPDSSDTNTVTESKTKQSSAILNILMILIGLFFLSKGVLEFLTWMNIIPLPVWLQSIYEKVNSKDLSSALSFLGTQGIVTAILGFWALIAGILMFGEQESGWGMAVVILSMIVVMGIATIITWIITPASFDLTYWPNWITLLTVIVGLFSFIYLLMTKKRYT